MTELCDLARKWGTDKAIYYTPYYHELFHERRNEVKKVLELGIGHPETMLSSVCRMGLTSYLIGASLYMWRDYFPNADIYALDNKRDIFVNDVRIKSFFVDQEIPLTFHYAAEEVGKDFDIIIEDGNHTELCQCTSALRLLPLLKPGGIYVIEDVGEWANNLLNRLVVMAGYRCELVDFGEARIIVVRK